MKSRNTKQKEIIEYTISKFDNFFSSEELYKKVSLVDSSIGIATIYRYLKEEKNKNKINVFICDRRQIYSRNKIIHSHFICDICQNHTSIEINAIDFVKNKIDGKINNILIDVRGICDVCRTK